MHGSVIRMVTALLLSAAGYAILRTGALPRWAGRIAYLLALVNLAFVPSMYILRRDEGGRTEFVTLTFWDSIEAVRGFAGPNIGRALSTPRTIAS